MTKVENYLWIDSRHGVKGDATDVTRLSIKLRTKVIHQKAPTHTRPRRTAGAMLMNEPDSQIRAGQVPTTTGRTMMVTNVDVVGREGTMIQLFHILVSGSEILPTALLL